MVLPLMVDLSSNNGAVDLQTHWSRGYRVLALKVTEGTTYAWDQSHSLAKQWHSYGGIVHHYHFLYPGDGRAQADFFWLHVRSDLGVGDRFVVDCETSGENGGEAHAFIDQITEHCPEHGGLIYGSPYFLRDNGITPVHGWGLWLAQYADKIEFIPPGWQGYAAWQFTQTGSAPGVNGHVDVSRLHPVLLHPTLHAGDFSFPVLTAKQLLDAKGYGKGLAMNNKYGWGLRCQVYRFKKKHGFGNPSGRVIGGRMWSALTAK